MATTIAIVGALLSASGCRGNAPLETQQTFGSDRRASFRVHDERLGMSAEESRTAIGAPRQVAARPVGSPTIRGSTIEQAYRLGPSYADARLVLRRTLRRKGDSQWRTLPPSLTRSRGGSLLVAFANDEPVQGEYEVFTEVFAVPPAEETFTADPLRVEADAVLVGGYGLSPVALGLSRSPVEFRILAREGDKTEVLLEKQLEPDQESHHGWSDYRIDLSRFAGKTVAFEFATRLVRAGERNSLDVALPAWSAPRVVVRRPESKRKNVVLISLDTLRADFVGAYGKRDDTTPNLDRLASQGVLFENAFTTYPSTSASHMSMLTGVYPGVHGIYGPGKKLAPGIRTLAEIFSEAGYQTVAVTENGMLTAGAGFNRGFGFYREFKEKVADNEGVAEDVVTSAISWLDAHRDERFFMFLHTYQVHHPYKAPAAFDVFKTYQENGQTVTLNENTAPGIRSRLGYAGDVLYTDSEVARVLRHLDRLGETERTVVVVTSDHGEALGEHGVIGHSWYVMDVILHVPLIIRAPGVLPEGVRVETPVSLVDIAPTVIQLAGLESTVPMQGTSLVEFLPGRDHAAPSRRVVYSEKVNQAKEPTVVARTLDSKWVADPDKLVRYDVVADPTESTPLSSEQDVTSGREAITAYRQWNEHMLRRLDDPHATESPVDDATTQKLRALGYIK